MNKELNLSIRQSSMDIIYLFEDGYGLYHFDNKC